MTREETKKLLLTIVAAFPNFKPENATLTVDTWHWALEEYPAPAVKASLQIYLKTNKSGFAPSVSQIIDGIHSPQDNSRMTEGEAWAMVKRTLADCVYNTKERFDELPPEVRRAIGGPEVLRQWAMTDSDEVNTVIMSNFQRSYKAVVSQQEYAERVPDAISDVIKGLSAKAAPRIGANG